MKKHITATNKAYQIHLALIPNVFFRLLQMTNASLQGFQHIQYVQDCLQYNESNREIDFIIRKNNGNITAIECKINPDQFDAGSLNVFRSLYQKGENVVISPWISEMYRLKINGLNVEYHYPASWRLSQSYNATVA